MTDKPNVAKAADVLILSLTFPPDGVATAHIMGELAADLRAAGKHITIETAGTVPPSGIDCDLASLSPKLAMNFTCSMHRRLQCD